MKLYPLLTLFALSACTSQPQATDSSSAQNKIDEAETRRVLDHHWEAFKANDLDAVMADYVEESILVTPDKTVQGLTDLRAHFAAAFKVFPKDSTTATLNKSLAVRDIGYIVWGAATPTIQLVYATDTFIIQDGKIVRQTYAGLADAE